MQDCERIDWGEKNGLSTVNGGSENRAMIYIDLFHT